MPAANVPLVIDQGEDFATQIVWTDSFDEPYQVIAPCRLDIKNSQNSTQLTLETPADELEDGEIPEIGLSSDIGLIQLHIPYSQTQELVPGEYHYDLFVTVDDGNVYTGPQRTRLLYGQVTVNKRVTQM